MRNTLVSVVIPTSNRPQLLAKLLDGLRVQSLQEPFEVIVVDDCERTNLNHLCAHNSRYRIIVVRGESRGPSRARNLGASHALGTHLVFLDDDSVVDSHYLARIVKGLQQRPGYALSGPQVCVADANCYGLAAEWLADRFVAAERLAPSRYGFAPSNGFALRRADFYRSGSFSPDFLLAAGEDREFCFRWVAAGFHIDVLAEFAIQHHFPRTLAKFVEQQWRYGRGAFHYAISVPDERRPRVRSIGFYVDEVLGPLSRYGVFRGIPVCFLAALSQLTILAGYVRERRALSTQKYPAVVAPARETR